MLKLNCCQAKAGDRKWLKVHENLAAAFLKSLISNAHEPSGRKLLKSVMLNTNLREASKNAADVCAWLKLILNWSYFLTKAVHIFSYSSFLKLSTIACLGTKEALSVPV